MKKHFKAYVGGFAGAPQVRARLMAAGDLAEVREILATVPLVTADC
jgi:hypothetical protein